MFGSKIPEWFNYVLRNHFRFGGHFEYLECKLSGLRKICDGLRLSNFQKLDLLVFTYDCGGFFKLSLFDGSSVEVRLDVNEITFGKFSFWGCFIYSRDGVKFLFFLVQVLYF